MFLNNLKTDVVVQPLSSSQLVCPELPLAHWSSNTSYLFTSEYIILGLRETVLTVFFSSLTWFIRCFTCFSFVAYDLVCTHRFVFIQLLHKITREIPEFSVMVTFRKSAWHPLSEMMAVFICRTVTRFRATTSLSFLERSLRLSWSRYLVKWRSRSYIPYSVKWYAFIFLVEICFDVIKFLWRQGIVLGYSLTWSVKQRCQIYTVSRNACSATADFLNWHIWQLRLCSEILVSKFLSLMS